MILEPAMHEVIQSLVRHGYAILIFWIFSERIGVPIPALPPLLAAGALAEMGLMSLPLSIIVAFVAVMMSDVIWFILGRYKGSRILSWLCLISMEPDSCVRRTHRFFSRHGASSLLFAKFIPGLSTLTTPLAGIIRMRFDRFLLYNAMGTLLWVGVFTGAGYLFSREIDLEKIVLPEWDNRIWLLIFVGFLTGYVVWKYARKQYVLKELFAKRILPEELKRRLDGGEVVSVIDVRHPLEFNVDPYVIPGALYVPLEELAHDFDVPRDREIVPYCV